MKRLFKWDRKINGNCPVQANGWFLNFYFYFRARNSNATLEFYKEKVDFYLNDPEYFFMLKETEPYRAGWLNKNFCFLLILKGCFLFVFELIKNKLKNLLKKFA